MASWVLLLCVLLPAVTGVQSEHRDGRLCAFTSSAQGAEPALAGEPRGVVQENGTVRCSPDSRCYGLWEKRADGEMRLLNQGCWTHVGNQQECRSERCVLVVATPSQVWTANYRFCCCSRDLCNANFTDVPPTSDTPALSPMMDSRSEAQPGYQLRPAETVLVALVTVAIGAIVVMALFLGYRMMKRKKKHTLSAVDVMEPGNSDSNIDLNNLKLLELIGRGRYGAVFRGSLKERYVAVKVFSSSNWHNYSNERSIYFLPLLQQHDNIARFLAADERTTADGQLELLILMEFYPHGCLSQYLSRHSVDWLTCCRMTHGVTRGLAFLHTELHRGDEHKPAVAHRDLTSRNVLVRSDLSCVLADFGLSMKLSGAGPCRPGDDDTMTISEVGTVRYMSPEVLGGALNLRDCEAALKQVDVYALGLLYWESFRRCSDLFPGEVVPEYQLAFQEELGNHPSLEDMQSLVVREKFRPRFPEAWKENNLALRLLKETMEDCWDQDAEARLTAQCAEERLCDLTMMATHTAVHNHRNLSQGSGYSSSFIEDLQVGVVKNLQGDAHPASVIITTTSGGDTTEKNRNTINYARQQAQSLLVSGGAVSTTVTVPPPPTVCTVSESQHTGGAVASVPACLQLTEEDLQANKLDPEEVEKNLRENSDENLMECSQKHFTSVPRSAALLVQQGDVSGASTPQWGRNLSGPASPPASCLHPLPKQLNLPQRPNSLHLLSKATDAGSPRPKLRSNQRQVQTGVAKMNTVAVVMPAEPQLVFVAADSMSTRGHAPAGRDISSVVVVGPGCSAGVPTLVNNEPVGGGRTNPAGPQEEEEVGGPVGGKVNQGLNVLNFSPDEHEPLLRREQLPAHSEPPSQHRFQQGRGSNSNNNNNRSGAAEGSALEPENMRLPGAPSKTQISQQAPAAAGQSVRSSATAPGQESEEVSSTHVENKDPSPSLPNTAERAAVAPQDKTDAVVQDCSRPDSDPVRGAETRKPSSPTRLPSESESPASNPGSGTSVPLEPAALEPLAAVLLQTRKGASKGRRPERPCSLDLSSCTSFDDASLSDTGSLSASGEKIKRRVKTPYTLKKWRPASWVVSTETALDPEFEFTAGGIQASSSSGLLRAERAVCPKINQSKSSISVFLVGGGATATTTSEPGKALCF